MSDKNLPSDVPEQDPAPNEPIPASPSASNADGTANEAGQKGKPNRKPGESLTEDHVREALKEVIDPELFVNIVDLGLVYTVDIVHRDDGKYDVNVEMTMTSPMCPAGPQLVGGARSVVAAIEDVEQVDVKVVMDPPWNQDMMSEDARDQLNIF